MGIIKIKTKLDRKLMYELYSIFLLSHQRYLWCSTVLYTKNTTILNCISFREHLYWGLSISSKRLKSLNSFRSSNISLICWTDAFHGKRHVAFNVANLYDYLECFSINVRDSLFVILLSNQNLYNREICGWQPFAKAKVCI